MNPARLCQLFDAKFSRGVHSGHRTDSVIQNAMGPGVARYVDLSPREDDDDDGTRLAAYFAGGA